MCIRYPLRLFGLLMLGRYLVVPLISSRVAVPYRHKAEPPQYPGQNLRCLGGNRSIFGKPGIKGPGMLDLELV